MKTYNFLVPTVVIHGQNCIKEHGSYFKAFGKKALIVTGRSSAHKCGALGDVTAALKVNGQEYTVYSQITPNPAVDCIFDGALPARKEKFDMVIAIGGGSPLDAAKAIAMLAVNATVTKENLFSTPFNTALPVIAIPTTAGTGSEVTQYAIITNDEAGTKTSLASPLLFPRIAFLDARYTEQLGMSTTRNTAIDALSHAVEGMLSCRSSVFTDVLSKESLRMIASCGKVLKEGNLKTTDRDTLLLASTMAGMVIANTGTTAVHALGYSLTYYKGVDHGRANGFLLSHFLMVVNRRCPERIAEILSCFGYQEIRQLTDFLDSLFNRHERLTKQECEYFASKAMESKNHIDNCIIKPSEKDLIEVLVQAMMQ
ncbi:MAG: iron-containing alcohol dehydrogenase [Tannerellaceae bacterium]|jgi:alcohol dehydrogenase class IV|nr:iron-containing alcohol dehydrogenase [Tannerellaceae bacterium]